MEDLLRELIQVIKEANRPWDWRTMISLVIQALPLIAIIILIKERMEKKRPYLQVAYDILRGSLVCIVVSNVGQVAARVSSLKCDDDFCLQLPKKVQERFKGLYETDFVVVPNQKWVLSLNINSFEIKKFKQKEARFSIIFSRLDGRKICKEEKNINFGNYGGFLIYQSEMDEMRKEIKKLCEIVRKVKNKLPEKKNVIYCNEIKVVPCSAFEDEWENYIAGDQVENDEDTKANDPTLEN